MNRLISRFLSKSYRFWPITRLIITENRPLITWMSLWAILGDRLISNIITLTVITRKSLLTLTGWSVICYGADTIVFARIWTAGICSSNRLCVLWNIRYDSFQVVVNTSFSYFSKLVVFVICHFCSVVPFCCCRCCLRYGCSRFLCRCCCFCNRRCCFCCSCSSYVT